MKKEGWKEANRQGSDRQTVVLLEKRGIGEKHYYRIVVSFPHRVFEGAGKDLFVVASLHQVHPTRYAQRRRLQCREMHPFLTALRCSRASREMKGCMRGRLQSLNCI